MSIVVRVVVDGRACEVAVEGHESLLALLRNRLGLLATKDACAQGECGACSVWLDGTVVCSCLVAAVQADGADVRTVAAVDDRITAVQDALARCGAVQCGFCTPGIVIAAADLLARIPAPAGDDVVEALEGNLCRCTGYTKIIEAVETTVGASGA